MQDASATDEKKIWTPMTLTFLVCITFLVLQEGGARGLRKLQHRTENAKETQTASDFFMNTETACPPCFQLRPRRPPLPLLCIDSKQREGEAVWL